MTACFCNLICLGSFIAMFKHGSYWRLLKEPLSKWIIMHLLIYNHEGRSETLVFEYLVLGSALANDMFKPQMHRRALFSGISHGRIDSHKWMKWKTNKQKERQQQQQNKTKPPTRQRHYFISNHKCIQIWFSVNILLNWKKSQETGVSDQQQSTCL